MSLVESLTCPCKPLFIWPSKTSFKAHLKSNRHIAHEATSKETKMDKTRKDNRIFQLEMQLAYVQEQVERLSAEKATLAERLSEYENASVDPKLFCLALSECKKLKRLNAVLTKKIGSCVEFYDASEE
jgi:predicted nuclease with TOPRIM domain